MSATSMNMHIDKTRRYILLFGIYYLVVRVYLKHFVGKDLFDLSVFANYGHENEAYNNMKNV